LTSTKELSCLSSFWPSLVAAGLFTLAATAPALISPEALAATPKQEMTSTDADLSDRAQTLLARMTLREKADQLAHCGT
jgi:hypothetical protein